MGRFKPLTRCEGGPDCWAMVERGKVCNACQRKQRWLPKSENRWPHGARGTVATTAQQRR
jgi:hypothetical protein